MYSILHFCAATLYLNFALQKRSRPSDYYASHALHPVVCKRILHYSTSTCVYVCECAIPGIAPLLFSRLPKAMHWKIPPGHLPPLSFFNISSPILLFHARKLKLGMCSHDWGGGALTVMHRHSHFVCQDKNVTRSFSYYDEGKMLSDWEVMWWSEMDKVGISIVLPGTYCTYMGLFMTFFYVCIRSISADHRR